MENQIILSDNEKRWIKLCKNHYKDKYPIDVYNWIDSLKPMFNEFYGWDADEFYTDYLRCVFNRLLDIYLKIELDYSGSRTQLKSIFDSAFGYSTIRVHELPIERAIAELCGQIQCNTVIDNGVQRYSLDLENEDNIS